MNFNINKINRKTDKDKTNSISLQVNAVIYKKDISDIVLTNKNVVVLNFCHNLGFETIEYLLNKGIHVLGIDNIEKLKENPIKKIKHLLEYKHFSFQNCNFNSQKIKKFNQFFSPDYFIYFPLDNNYYKNDPFEIMKINIEYYLFLLNVLKKNNSAKMIYIEELTNDIKIHNNRLINQTDKEIPITPNSISNITNKILNSYFISSELPLIIVNNMDENMNETFFEKIKNEIMKD